MILLCACLLEEVVLCRSNAAEVGCHFYLAEAQAKPMQTGEQLFEDSSLQQGNLHESAWPVMSKLNLRISVTAPSEGQRSCLHYILSKNMELLCSNSPVLYLISNTDCTKMGEEEDQMIKKITKKHRAQLWNLKIHEMRSKKPAASHLGRI